MDQFEPLRPILEEHAVQVSPKEFHSIVNEVFHSFEAEVYDEVHRHMWASLPTQFDLFAADHRDEVGEGSLTVLDVGCGTGLATELLMRSPLGPSITGVTLLDPSREMLERASERSRSWNIEAETRLGFLEDLPPGTTFGLVIACSVLHHIPDLAGFCTKVAGVTEPGGSFLHIHDPNGDISGSREAAARAADLARAVSPSGVRDRLRPRHVVGKVRSVFPRLGRRPYLDRVNEELERRGVIASALSPQEIWRITDLRVYDGKGVRISDLADLLPPFRLVSARTYGFFGRLRSELPEDLRSEEDRLVAATSPTGAFMGGLWRRI